MNLSPMVYCLIALVAYMIWYSLIRFFVYKMTKEITHNKSTPYITPHYLFKWQFLVFHFLCICGFIIFSSMFLDTIDSQYVATSLAIQFKENRIEFNSQYAFIFTFFFCIILYILSILDWLFLCVPNILLFVLFIISNGIYFFTYGFYDGYPFMILGILYVSYFFIHLFCRHEVLGQGDIWVIASIAICIESFFVEQYEIIFQILICASLLGICLYIWLSKQKKKIFAKHRSTLQHTITHKDSIQHDVTSLSMDADTIQIPFIPLLTLGFIIVGIWHAA